MKDEWLVKVIDQTKRWLYEVVLDLNLCPFAHEPFKTDRIRYFVSQNLEIDELLQQLQQEIEYLDSIEPEKLETILFILSDALQEFLDFNDFLHLVNDFLLLQDWAANYQIASFHPKYQFAGTEDKDHENYTNRSPFPILQILRESSVTKATESEINVTEIPKHNIQVMNQFSRQEIERLFPYQD